MQSNIVDLPLNFFQCLIQNQSFNPNLNEIGNKYMLAAMYLAG